MQSRAFLLPSDRLSADDVFRMIQFVRGPSVMLTPMHTAPKAQWFCQRIVRASHNEVVRV